MKQSLEQQSLRYVGFRREMKRHGLPMRLSSALIYSYWESGESTASCGLNIERLIHDIETGWIISKRMIGQKSLTLLQNWYSARTGKKVSNKYQISGSAGILKLESR